jgi:hypothetical protein
MNDEISSFKSDGFLHFNNLLDIDKCKDLYLKLKKNRDWSNNLFQSEEEFKKEFKNNPLLKKTNPGKGIQNLAGECNLDFIEKNPKILETLNFILGKNYEIMLSKFVVAVPINWMPDYLKLINQNSLISNFNPYIKKEYRDVTYFRGIDYHMDSIDWEEQDNHFITMYIYLNKVDEYMSPLNLIKQSHINGHTSFPHYIKDYPKKNYLEYSSDNKNFKKFEKKMLIGNAGSVYFWTSNTLHGTAPSNSEKEDFRISLRYLIKKNKNTSSILNKMLPSAKVGSTRIKKNEYKRILI